MPGWLVEDRMTEDSAKPETAGGPAVGESAAHRQAEQRQRLAEALRANLQKRKRQARLRDAPEE
jgi:hypothetical protein